MAGRAKAGGWWGRGLAILIVVALVVAAVVLVRQERSGPPRIELEVGDGVPATLYVPGEPGETFFPEAPPSDERFAGVVVAHGFAADRPIMSGLARGLAEHGYVALSIDFRGHGANQLPFRGELRGDLEAAVDWLAASPYVDPEQIAVLGHSMGAGAVLDFASRDPRPVAVIPVSGGFATEGDRRPPNVLFIVASGDPEGIHRGIDRTARRLAEADTFERETRHGNFEDGSAVRVVEVPQTDHVTVLWADQTLAETVEWLDEVTGTQRVGPVGLDDPRLLTAGVYLLLALILIGALGRFAGGLVPRMERPGAKRIPAGVGLLALVLVAALPFVALAPPAAFVPLVVGDTLLSHFALGGALLLIGRWAISRRTARPVGWIALDRPLSLSRGTVAVAVLAGLAVYVLLMPLGVVFHRLALTPQRFAVALVAAALLLPFLLAFEGLLRRGSTPVALLGGVLGRLVILAVLFGGAVTGLLPGVIVVILPILVLVFVLFEVFAVAAYSSGGNIAMIAATQSLWMGWLMAVTMPITM